MKERLDVLLVKRNLAESREKAKAIIMSGNVFVDGEREDKAGTSFSDDNNFTTRFVICISSVNICTIKCPANANVTEKHVAVMIPHIAAFLVPLLHFSNSFAPILQPVIIAFA